MGLDVYIRELLSPNKYIKDENHFWDRYKSDILEQDKVKDLFSRIRDNYDADTAETRINNLESKLASITKENFQKYGANYFSQRPVGSTIVRYGALGAGILGGVTAAGAIFALAAGGPLTALAGLGLGLAYLFGAGAANISADMYDATQATKAIDGRLKKKEGGVFNYLKRAVTGVWDVISSPFRKSSYKAVGALAEGVVTNGIAMYGAPLIMQYLEPMIGAATPYAQVGTFAASGIAFYRGRKKFDNLVIDHIVKQSEKQFISQYVSDAEAKIVPMTRGNMVPITTAYRPGEGIYAGMQAKMGIKPRILNSVKPRRAIEPMKAAG